MVMIITVLMTVTTAVKVMTILTETLTIDFNKSLGLINVIDLMSLLKCSVRQEMKYAG